MAASLEVDVYKRHLLPLFFDVPVHYQSHHNLHHIPPPILSNIPTTMLPKPILASAFLASLVVAAPVTEPDADLSKRKVLAPFPLAESGDTLKARSIAKRDAINISMFGGNGCTSQAHGISQIGGSPTCYPVPASKRSIHIWGE
jgi:hypothetical protein